jgi:hypothetical protein
MFYEVKVSFPKNNKKIIILPKELSRRHWSVFDENQRGFIAAKKNKKIIYDEKTHI